MRAFLFSIVSVGLLLAGCFVAEPISSPASPPQPPARSVATPAPEMSPHAEALQLVFTKGAKRIREVELAFAKATKAVEPKFKIGDEEFWWHDVAKREWTADRPFYPGYIDSTHMFFVAYRIDGKVVASWSVDTRLGTVSSDDETRFAPAK